MALYKPGESGNPGGKKPGTINKRTQLSKLLEPHATELINKAVELARNGDVNALRLCIERLLPKARSETISMSLPNIDYTKAPALLILGDEIIHAIANQELTPEQGKTLASVIEAQRKTIETGELANRIEEIEYTLNLRKQVKDHDKT
jgi:hypothetical protein